MATRQKRFRFSAKDDLKAISELFNIVCEDISTSEAEMWSNLKNVLCHDDSRFELCTPRLLKDHLLEQVAKYKKYDSDEATESGRERLKSDWGEKMQQLMTVWENYKQLTELENAMKMQTKGRPKKAVFKKQQDEATLAKQIRDAALSSLMTASTSQANDEEFAVLEDENLPTEISTVNQTDSSTSGENNDNNIIRRKTTTPASKRRCSSGKVDGVWLYLAEKSQKELELKERMHKEEIALKREEIELKREQLKYDTEKLKFQVSKWEHEQTERDQTQQTNVATNNLLSSILQHVITKEK